jgi:hypothetical protein
MTLAQYIKDEGFEYEECYYENSEDLLHTGFLGFCGCGNPADSLNYILGGLQLIAEEQPDGVGWIDWFHDRNTRSLKYFGSEQARLFFYYWADKEKLTEHGGCVPGWLTAKGEELLALIAEWKVTESENDAQDSHS